MKGLIILIAYALIQVFGSHHLVLGQDVPDIHHDSNMLQPDIQLVVVRAFLVPLSLELRNPLESNVSIQVESRVYQQVNIIYSANFMFYLSDRGDRDYVSMYHALGSRYYYNQKSRLEQNKIISKYAGEYVTVYAIYIPWANENRKLSWGQGWGMQRTIYNSLYLGLETGVHVLYPNIRIYGHCRIGFVF